MILTDGENKRLEHFKISPGILKVLKHFSEQKWIRI